MTPKIYKITNDLNSKKYVGQTYKTIDERFDRHCGEATWRNTKKMPIVLAIKKYGKEHFRIHLLEELPVGSTKQQVDDKEVEWGMRLNTLSPNGYNLKLGGGRGICSEETKEKIRRGNIGRKATEETRKKLVESHLGIRVSEEAKKKLSNIFSGKTPHANTADGASRKNSKTCVFRNTLGEEEVSENMRMFCEKYGLCRGNLSKLVQGKIAEYKGWRLVKDLGKNRDRVEEKACVL